VGILQVHDRRHEESACGHSIYPWKQFISQLDFSDTLSEPGLKILTVFGCYCRCEDLLAGLIGQNQVRVGDGDHLK